MGTNFYIKFHEKDFAIWEGAYIRYLYRFLRNTDFRQELSERYLYFKDHPTNLKYEALKALGASRDEEACKLSKLLSRVNQYSITEELVENYRGHLFVGSKKDEKPGFYSSAGLVFPGADVHIGKRSAAGYYCADCGATSCIDGSDAIHFSISRTNDQPDGEPRTCDLCGSTNMKYGCSFTWQFDKEFWEEIFEKLGKRAKVVNEYEEVFTIKKFLNKELGNIAFEYKEWCDFS